MTHEVIFLLAALFLWAQIVLCSFDVIIWLCFSCWSPIQEKSMNRSIHYVGYGDESKFLLVNFFLAPGVSCREIERWTLGSGYSLCCCCSTDRWECRIVNSRVVQSTLFWISSCIYKFAFDSYSSESCSVWCSRACKKCTSLVFSWVFYLYVFVIANFLLFERVDEHIWLSIIFLFALLGFLACSYMKDRLMSVNCIYICLSKK